MKKLILAILLGLSVSAMFAQEVPLVNTECGPWVTNVTENEMTVVWISTGRSMGWVELAPDDGFPCYGEFEQ